MKIFNENNGIGDYGEYQFFNNTYEFNLKIFYSREKLCLFCDDEHIDIGFDNFDNSMHGFCFEYNGKIIIWLKNKKVGLETIAHESLHGVNKILNIHGVKFRYDNDEPQAYLLSWFIKCIHDSKKVKV